MSNISYFEVPADDVKRAKKFYTQVLGWDFAPTEIPGIPVEYWNITTGKSSKDTLNMGGLYQRREQSSRMIMYAVVDNLDHALAKVEEMGGKILSPKMSLKTVGDLATIIDSEGNVFGLWEREKKTSKEPRSR
jgi:predicted enzyme related to lactoylglutathione lyase